MELIEPILTQGGLGVVAAIFFFMYRSEKAEHREDNKLHQEKIEALQEARRTDAIEVRDQVTGLAGDISQSLSQLGGKIEIGRRRQ